MHAKARTLPEKLILFVAEGFGTGRFPVAPGTIGTLVGFAWIYLLLIPANLYLFLADTTLGVLAAVWIGGAAEKISGKKDPGSIVIDEIVALPIAFLGAALVKSIGSFTPSFPTYFNGAGLLVILVTFAGFRLFDITKPWLINRVQDLPSGWGLVFDDVLAALHVIPLTYAAARLFSSH